MFVYVRISLLSILSFLALWSGVTFAWAEKIDPIKYWGSWMIVFGVGKIDAPKIASGSLLTEDGTGSFLERKEETAHGWSISKITEDSRSATDTRDKDERRNKIQEKRDIIKTLDEGIIKFLQPRDKKSFREIRKNYPDLNDQKSALLIFRSSLIKRYDAFDNKSNRLVSDYYTGLFSEIDSQIEEINTALVDENNREKKNIFQSLIESIFH